MSNSFSISFWNRSTIVLKHGGALDSHLRDASIYVTFFKNVLHAQNMIFNYFQHKFDMNYIVCAKKINDYFHINPLFLVSCFLPYKYFSKEQVLPTMFSSALSTIQITTSLHNNFFCSKYIRPKLRSQQLTASWIIPTMVQGNKRVDPPSPATSGTSSGSFFLSSPARSAGRLQRPKTAVSVRDPCVMRN